MERVDSGIGAWTRLSPGPAATQTIDAKIMPEGQRYVSVSIAGSAFEYLIKFQFENNFEECLEF